MVFLLLPEPVRPLIRILSFIPVTILLPPFFMTIRFLSVSFSLFVVKV